MDSSLANVRVWEKTTNLRLHRYITHYTWSYKWNAAYTETIQQQHRCIETGETKWEPVEIFEETAHDCVHYG